MKLNQTVIIRDLIASKAMKQAPVEGVVAKMSATGKRIEVTTGVGVRVFYISPRNGHFYESGTNIPARFCINKSTEV